MKKWQEIEHTADVAIHVWGTSLSDLFIAAAQGMFALMAEGGQDACAVRSVELTAPDVEVLLVDWLNELLYLNECEGAVFTDIVFLQLTSTALRAEVVGYAVEHPRAHIKAATYHMLCVEAYGDGYETEIVFDV